MRTVLLVDDDMLVINRLRGLVDWTALGYAIAGQAMDGNAALAMAERLQPDLIMLDINMPRKDGIAVIQELREKAPGAYVLILSNHDTFEYVRETMRYGAFDYLLKHQLTAELLQKKLAEMERKRQQDTLSEQRDHYFAELARQQYLRELITRGVVDAQQHALMRAQPEFSAGRFVLAALRIENLGLFTWFDGQAERDRLTVSVVNLASNVLAAAGNGLLASTGSGAFAVLFSFGEVTPPGQAQEQAKACVSLLASNLRRVLNVSLAYQLSGVLASIDLVPAAYRQVDAVLAATPGAATDIRDEQRLIDALDAMDLSRTTQAVSDILAEQGVAAAPHLLRIGEHWRQEQQLTLPDTYLRQFQNAFRMPLDADELRQRLGEHFRVLLTQAIATASAGYSRHVRDTIAFIHTHYRDDISLSAAAEHTGVSTAHLSRQFGKETGLSFVDYLTAYRIEAAKELLKRPGAKIKDVCRQVGFQNYNYFLRVFKKTTGQTTTQSNGEGE